MGKMTKTWQLIINGGCALSLLSAAVLTPNVYAQSQISVPDSGSLLQQQRQPLAVPKLKQEGVYELRAPVDASNSPPFYVNRINLEGNQVVSSEALQGLLQPYQERELTLNDLQVLCYEIGDNYRQQGYLFSRAVVPQQSVADGVVQLRVIEAKLDQVAINNKSGINSVFLQNIVKPVQQHQSINEKELNSALLLMKDLPGVEVKTAIQAGSAVGQSDLVVSVRERRPEHRLSVNNYGSQATHRLRASGQFNLANLAGYGDLLALNLSSSGERMVQAGVNYQFGLGANDSRLGFNLSYLDYALGENLKDLNAEGQAKTVGVYWRQQWQRGLSRNLYSRVSLQRQILEDQINNGLFQTNRDVDTLSININGDWRDALAENSVSQIGLGLKAGQVTFTDADAEQRDARSTDSQGDFSYLTLDLQHRQALNADWQYSLRLGAQKSFDNLDSSQKFSAAGPYGVRAYEVGAISGDSSVLFSSELSYFWMENPLGNFTLYGFADAARIQINQRLWQGATGRNRLSLAGAGFGLRWQGFEHWNASTYAAAPLGSSPSELGKSKSGLLWFELSRRF